MPSDLHRQPLFETRFLSDGPQWSEDRWLITTIRALKFALSAVVGLGLMVALVVWALRGVVG
jgi:hypothetical protein